MKKHIFASLVSVALIILSVATFASCDAFKKPSEGLEFTSNGNRTCFVSGIGSCPDENVVIPKQSPQGDFVTSIGSSAFDNCYGLVSVSFEDDSRVARIGSQAFANCESLKSIKFPKSLTYIEYNAISNSVNLENITVEKGNTVYHSEGNCIIEIASNKLVLGCKNSIIPEYVTAIGYLAFSHCSNLTSIKIPNNVTSIESYAFEYCTSLTSISIPNSVDSIEDYSFRYCTSLTTIKYDGTMAQWNAINKRKSIVDIDESGMYGSYYMSSDWDYNTGDYTVYCTDGNIRK